MDPNQVAMISVHYDSVCIRGLKLQNQAGEVLLKVKFNSGHSVQDIALAEGERLLGIRSQQFNDSNYDTCHCNMVFVIGRME